MKKQATITAGANAGRRSIRWSAIIHSEGWHGQPARPGGLPYLFSEVELVALRRVVPRPAAQRLLADHASRSAAARGGVVAARQPLPLNTYGLPARQNRGTPVGVYESTSDPCGKLPPGSAAASAARVGASPTGKGRETSGCRVDCNRRQHVFGGGAEHDTRGRVWSPYDSNAKQTPSRDWGWLVKNLRYSTLQVCDGVWTICGLKARHVTA